MVPNDAMIRTANNGSSGSTLGALSARKSVLIPTYRPSQFFTVVSSIPRDRPPVRLDAAAHNGVNTTLALSIVAHG